MAKKQIILLTTEPKSFVQEKFKESCDKKDIDLEVINPSECYIYLATDAHFSNKGAKFQKADACIPRLSEDNLDYKVAIIKHLEKLGVFVLNSGNSMRTASNKIETQIVLNDAGIKTPKSALFVNEEQLDKAVKAIGGKFPVIVKTIFGTHGVGVMRADSSASLISICQQLIKSNVEFILQEYIEHEESARILILDDQPLASVMRSIPDGDFRSNAHQGAKLRKYEPDQDEIDICVKAANLIGAKFSAVDYIVSEKDGKKEIYLLEINGSPGFEAMQEVIDFDIADKVIDFVVSNIGNKEESEDENEEETKEISKEKSKGVEQVADENEEEVESESDTSGKTTEEDEEPGGKNAEENDLPSKEESPEPSDKNVIEPEKEKISNDDFNVIGTVDKIIIKYFNDEKPIDARIDTGAEYSSINGSDINLTDETISFSFGDYRYRFSLLKSVKIVSANGKESRPIIRADIDINGNILHNVEFTVNDREGLNYDVLLGRRALAQANILVNPAFSQIDIDKKKEDDSSQENDKKEKPEEE
jgi:RimK family alpha-L-glutamate ligase